MAFVLPPCHWFALCAVYARYYLQIPCQSSFFPCLCHFVRKRLSRRDRGHHVFPVGSVYGVFGAKAHHIPVIVSMWRECWPFFDHLLRVYVIPGICANICLAFPCISRTRAASLYIVAKCIACSTFLPSSFFSA